MLSALLCSSKGGVAEDLDLKRLDFHLADSLSFAWICLTTPSAAELTAGFENAFPVQRLTLEDVRKIEGTAKVDDYGEYTVVVFHSVEDSGDMLSPACVEVVAILGRQVLITVRHHPEQVLDAESQEEACSLSADAVEELGLAGLLYRLMELSAATSCQNLDLFSDRLEGLGDVIFSPGISTRSQNQLMEELLTAKSAALRLHRTPRPQSDLLAELGQSHFIVVPGAAWIYFQDVKNQVDFLVAKSGDLRELAVGTMTTHLTLDNHRLNEVMKMLTMIATIFMPLTFVTSVYGMNFKRMPELQWGWAYPATMGLCLLIACIMLFYFRCRRWF